MAASFRAGTRSLPPGPYDLSVQSRGCSKIFALSDTGSADLVRGVVGKLLLVEPGSDVLGCTCASHRIEIRTVAAAAAVAAVAAMVGDRQRVEGGAFWKEE